MIENMIGQKYGRLTITNHYYETNSNGEKRDFCDADCDCGNTKEHVYGKNIRRNMTISCGCYQLERNFEASKKYNEYDLTNDFGIIYFSNKNTIHLFDISDYERVKYYCWAENQHGYLVTKMNDKDITFQNFVMNNHDSKIRVDHKNRKRNDNRKENLRLATHQENSINKSISSSNTSGIIGISYSKNQNLWECYLAIKGKRVLREYCENIQEAIILRLQAEKKYFGEFAPQQHLFEEYGV